MLRSISLLSVFLAICGVANATNYYVSETGTFAGSDTAQSLVQPNGTFHMTFVVDGNPTPLSGSVTSLGFDASISAFAYTLNGTQIATSPTEVRFNTMANVGLFDVTFGTGLNAAEFSFEGAQAFTGTTSAPMFSAGSFPLTSWTYSDPSNYDTETPTGASVSLTPTPEPTSAGLTLSAFAVAIAFLARRKSLLAR